jgi:hypothetical protein
MAKVKVVMREESYIEMAFGSSFVHRLPEWNAQE